MTRRSSRRAMSVACGLVAAAFALGACGGGDDEGGAGAAASTGGETPAQQDVNVAYFTASLADGYTQTLHETIGEDVRGRGGTAQTFNAEFDPQKQLQQCQDAIVTQKFQAFVIQPVDGPSMVSCARQAIDAGIQVVAMSNPIGPDVDTTKPQVPGLAGTILESPGSMGESLAQLTVDACAGKDPCKLIYEFGPAGFSFTANTRKAFKEAMAKQPSIDLVAEGSHEFVPDKARSLTKQLLQVNPDVDVITSDDDSTTASGLIDAVREAGKADQIKVIGGAGSQEGAALVASGDMFGTAVLVPRTAAKKAVDIAFKAVRGEDPGDTELDNARDLSPIGPILTKDNVDDFEAEWTQGG